MNKINILISGATGVTSRAVIRSLQISPIFSGKCTYIGTDVCYNEYGIYEGLYDKVYKVPYPSSPEYRPMMEQIIHENNIQYAFIIPEPEALYWYEYPFDVRYQRIPLNFAKRVISKKTLYDTLARTNLVPQYQIAKRSDILAKRINLRLSFPLWIRDFSEGTTSGKGSYLTHSEEELRAWALLNEGISSFMISEYLPGRNLGCFTLYHKGKLLKYGIAERIEYLMGRVSASGITGNTSKGKLVNDQSAIEVALSAINEVIRHTGEIMNGLVVTDMKCDYFGTPKVTEINIRHVAFTSTFAQAGLNFSEMQLLCAMGRENELPEGLTIEFPENNIMLRDVDGTPIYLNEYKPLNYGEFFPKS